MSDLKVGVFIDATAQRDAIHVAVAPVIAGIALQPGQHVGFKDGDAATVWPIADEPHGPQCRQSVGIIDPFLTVRIYPGQRCWLFLYPQTITSLRHDWTHPAFEHAAKELSEAWLRHFASTADCPDYNTLIAAAVGDHDKNYGDDGYLNSSNDGEYLHFGGHDAHGEIPQEFWQHVEIVTGKKIPPELRATSFSCSC